MVHDANEFDTLLHFRFQKAFNKEFQKPLDHVFSKPDQEWLIGILRRELEVDESEAVLHDKYIGRLTSDARILFVVQNLLVSFTIVFIIGCFY